MTKINRHLTRSQRRCAIGLAIKLSIGVRFSFTFPVLLGLSLARRLGEEAGRMDSGRRQRLSLVDSFNRCVARITNQRTVVHQSSLDLRGSYTACRSDIYAHGKAR